jgi:hypothetical protein
MPDQMLVGVFSEHDLPSDEPLTMQWTGQTWSSGIMKVRVYFVESRGSQFDFEVSSQVPFWQQQFVSAGNGSWVYDSARRGACFGKGDD